MTPTQHPHNWHSYSPPDHPSQRGMHDAPSSEHPSLNTPHYHVSASGTQHSSRTSTCSTYTPDRGPMIVELHRPESRRMDNLPPRLIADFSATSWRDRRTPMTSPRPPPPATYHRRLINPTDRTDVPPGNLRAQTFTSTWRSRPDTAFDLPPRELHAQLDPTGATFRTRLSVPPTFESRPLQDETAAPEHLFNPNPARFPSRGSETSAEGHCDNSRRYPHSLPRVSPTPSLQEPLNRESRAESPESGILVSSGVYSTGLSRGASVLPLCRSEFSMFTNGSPFATPREASFPIHAADRMRARSITSPQSSAPFKIMAIDCASESNQLTSKATKSESWSFEATTAGRHPASQRFPQLVVSADDDEAAAQHGPTPSLSQTKAAEIANLTGSSPSGPTKSSKTGDRQRADPSPDSPHPGQKTVPSSVCINAGSPLAKRSLHNSADGIHMEQPSKVPLRLVKFPQPAIDTINDVAQSQSSSAPEDQAKPGEPHGSENKKGSPPSSNDTSRSALIGVKTYSQTGPSQDTCNVRFATESSGAHDSSSDGHKPVAKPPRKRKATENMGVASGGVEKARMTTQRTTSTTAPNKQDNKLSEKFHDTGQIQAQAEPRPGEKSLGPFWKAWCTWDPHEAGMRHANRSLWELDGVRDMRPRSSNVKVQAALPDLPPPTVGAAFSLPPGELSEEGRRFLDHLDPKEFLVSDEELAGVFDSTTNLSVREVTDLRSNQGTERANILFPDFHSQGRLTIDEAALTRLLHSLMTDPHVSTSRAKLKPGNRSAQELSKVKQLVLETLPTPGQVHAISVLAAQMPGRRLFPNATRLYLKPAFQHQFSARMSLDYACGAHKLWVQSFASIADVHTLCTDYTFRALGNASVRVAMEELKTAWPSIQVHHIHIGEDDLPWTVPGIDHRPLYHVTQPPFNSGTGIAVVYAETCQDVAMLSPLDSRARKMTEVNAYDWWHDQLARTVVDDFVHYKGESKTTWNIRLPQLPCGDQRGSFNDSWRNLASMIRARFKEAVKNGATIQGVTVGDDGQAMEWLGQRLGMQPYRRSERLECEACGWTAADHLRDS